MTRLDLTARVQPTGNGWTTQLKVNRRNYGAPMEWPNPAGACRHLAQMLRVLETELAADEQHAKPHRRAAKPPKETEPSEPS